MKYKNIDKLKYDLRDIDKEIINLKTYFNQTDEQPLKVIGLLNSYYDLLKNYLIFIGPKSDYEKKLIDYKSIEYISNPNYEENTIISFFKDFISSNHNKKLIPNQSTECNEKKSIYSIEEEKEKSFKRQLYKIQEEIRKTFKYNYQYTNKYTQDHIDGKEIWESFSDLSSRKRDLLFYGLNEDQLPSFQCIENLLEQEIKMQADQEIINSWAKTISTNLFQKILANFEENRKTINSATFKNLLIENFSKYKNVIQKVSLNKLLGIKNKIIKDIDKMDQQSLHKQRIEKQKTNEGYIYIFSNKSFKDLIKIGSTMRDPIIRAKELSDTSVPFPYQVEYKILTINCEILEKIIHQKLSSKRVDLEREFFNCNIEEAIQVINETVELGR